MVHTDNDTHGIRQYARFITRINQCVHCRSVLNSREVAQNHTVEAERKGVCPTSRSKKEDGLVKITDMQCFICQHECMQTHLAQHSLFPPSTYKVPKHRRGNMDDPRSFEREAPSKPDIRPSTQGTSRKRRKQRRSPERGQSRVGGPPRNSTTLTVTEHIYEIARSVTDRRARIHGSDGIHVDAVAANFATSSRFREYNLLNAFPASSTSPPCTNGRNVSELLARRAREVQSVGSVEST